MMMIVIIIIIIIIIIGKIIIINPRGPKIPGATGPGYLAPWQ